MDTLSKEEREEKIRNHIQDGFQSDYDRLDNLVDVFKREEVVENVMIELEAHAKQDAIECLNFAMNNERLITDGGDANKIYELFLESKTT